MPPLVMIDADFDEITCFEWGYLCGTHTLFSDLRALDSSSDYGSIIQYRVAESRYQIGLTYSPHFLVPLPDNQLRLDAHNTQEPISLRITATKKVESTQGLSLSPLLR